MPSKEDFEKRLRFAYHNRTITLLKGVREEALQQGHYDVAEKAVMCMNGLVNPFTFYI